MNILILKEGFNGKGKNKCFNKGRHTREKKSQIAFVPHAGRSGDSDHRRFFCFSEKSQPLYTRSYRRTQSQDR